MGLLPTSHKLATGCWLGIDLYPQEQLNLQMEAVYSNVTINRGRIALIACGSWSGSDNCRGRWIPESQIKLQSIAFLTLES